jgi:beta-galactosidase
MRIAISLEGLSLAAVLVSILLVCTAAVAEFPVATPRERLCFDTGWRFAYDNTVDPSEDMTPGAGEFSYLAKAGYATGAAAPNFDDRSWRELDLPHDWAVEAPFDRRASGSHGSRAIGRGFPERSVGWYRKSFFVPHTDLGKRISVEFDGVFRDSQVWLNGHYLGREESGYSSFAYNITELLNYGGENVIAVRVDASLEEGWFYEGAGIYRHVWLGKTAPLHVERHGVFVTSELEGESASVRVRLRVQNASDRVMGFQFEQVILDSNGRQVAATGAQPSTLEAGEGGELEATLAVVQPQLWSPDAPHLYKVVTTLRDGETVYDQYETPFGIRTIRFDPNEGFFLNGEHVRLHGANNHQDHAGVGVAVPDALQEFRIAKLKEIGCNAYRCAHHPPAPELLDACDRLGMLVLDETRSMGVTATQLDQLKRMIIRDRNHPSVILWSIGNEEWSLEGSEAGERVTKTMQSLAKRLDPTRSVMLASCGNWGRGNSKPIEVMGFNYYTHGDTDEHHKSFPDQPSIGSEEGSTFSTRGVYFENLDRQHLTSYDENCPDWGSLAHKGWSHYADRPYVAGMFVWTGFDYRGEPTPFAWPAISSQFGILDTCGFRKDNSYYYEARWRDEPLLHVFPHWNWSGKEGKSIRVWAHTNCDSVELLLNEVSLGHRRVDPNGHAEWVVPYEPGVVVARGFRDGSMVAERQVETTESPNAVRLTPHRSELRADGQDVSVITVEVVDSDRRADPTANHEATFRLRGAGRILGVGNGDPSSHEPDKFLDSWSTIGLRWKQTTAMAPDREKVVSVHLDDSQWSDLDPPPAALVGDKDRRDSHHEVTIVRGVFDRPSLAPDAEVRLLLRFSGKAEVYVNERSVPLGENHSGDHVVSLRPDALQPKANVVAIVYEGPLDARDQNRLQQPAVIKVKTPPPLWKRSLFNGKAQVIVQSSLDPDQLILTASVPGLQDGIAKISTTK